MSPLSQVLKVFLKNYEWITNKETNHDSLNMLSPRFLLIRAWGMWYRSASTSLLLILPVPWIQILVFSFSLMNENWVFLAFFFSRPIHVFHSPQPSLTLHVLRKQNMTENVGFHVFFSIDLFLSLSIPNWMWCAVITNISLMGKI